MPFSKRTVGQSIDRVDGREKVLSRAMFMPCDRSHSSMVPTSTSTILRFTTNRPLTRRRRALSLGTLLAPAFGESMFTDPELARVGKNEVEARRDRIEYRMAKLPMAAVLRTKTISEPRGLMKALVAKDSDEILGLTAFAFEANELMVAMQTAMPGHLPYSVLCDANLTHPTMSEGLSQLLANVPVR